MAVNNISRSISSFLRAAYPIGSVYISVVSTSPATLFGFGTWSAFGAGKTLVGLDSGNTAFDTVEETGGAETVTLTSAQSGVPAHTHPITRPGLSSGGDLFFPGYGNEASSNPIATNNITGSNTAANAASAHTNLQPYIVTYMWKRTA